MEPIGVKKKPLQRYRFDVLKLKLLAPVSHAQVILSTVTFVETVSMRQHINEYRRAGAAVIGPITRVGYIQIWHEGNAPKKREHCPWSKD